MVEMPVLVQDPPVRLLSQFCALYPQHTPEHILQVPGREMWVMAVLHASREYCLQVPDLGKRTRFTWRSARQQQTCLRRPLPCWARYPAGVVVVLREAGLEVPGADMMIVGDEVPGPRYNYALGVALAALWHSIHSLPYNEPRLLDVVEKVHRDFVGN